MAFQEKIWNIWIRHDIELRRFTFKGKIEALTPLRIGSGRSEGHNIYILKDSRNRPYIPGSSLKGVFRSVGERIAKSKGLRVCTGHSNLTCMDTTGLSRKIIDMRSNIDASNYVSIYNKLLKEIFNLTCINCKIFGAPGLAAHIRLTDAYPIDENYSIGWRTGIAISRRTGAVAQGAIYRVEYVEPGSLFSFEIVGTNLPNYAVGYIAEIIDFINSGAARIGGFKTRGFGKVRIVPENISFTGIKNGKLEKLDDFDKPVEGLQDHYDGPQAAQVLEKFKEVWRNADIKYPESKS